MIIGDVDVTLHNLSSYQLNILNRKVLNMTFTSQLLNLNGFISNACTFKLLKVYFAQSFVLCLYGWYFCLVS